MISKTTKYKFFFILIIAITFICCEKLSEELKSLFPENPANTLDGTWEGIFYVDDNEEWSDSNEELIGIFEIIQDNKNLSGTAEIEALTRPLEMLDNDSIWDLTGSIEDLDINITLTISFISFFDSEITWIITSSGIANEDLDEITGTWEFEAWDLKGTFFLMKEEE